MLLRLGTVLHVWRLGTRTPTHACLPSSGLSAPPVVMKSKKTPLHVAAKHGDPEVAGALIQAGADVHAKDKVSVAGVGLCTAVRLSSMEWVLSMAVWCLCVVFFCCLVQVFFSRLCLLISRPLLVPLFLMLSYIPYTHSHI